MRWRTRLPYKQIGILAVCLGLLCLGASACWAVLPWYANNLLTYAPASPAPNDSVTYDWSAVLADITSVTPGSWTLKSTTMVISGPDSYLAVRQGTPSCSQPWLFASLGVYTVTLTITYATPSAVVDPSGGTASTAHTCIAPAITCVTLPPVSVIDAKKQADGAFVWLTGKVVTYSGPGLIYVEQDDRSAGIRLDGASGTFTTGMKVDVKGTLQTDNAVERAINVATIVQNGSGAVGAVGIANKAIGGGNWLYDPATGAGQRQIEDGVGVNNTGLLIKTWGRVTSTDTNGVCCISDGSGSNLRVEVSGVTGKPAQENQYVQVTGISGVTSGDSRVVLARGAADVVVEQAPAVYLYKTDLATAQKFQTLLGQNKIKVDIVAMTSADTVDYTKYSLVIIGHETNSGNDWGTQTAIDAIVNSGRRVLAIETGGAMFCGKLSLNMGQPKVTYNTGNQMTPTDSASPVYQTPYVIPTTGPITVSTNASGWYGNSSLIPIPSTVVALGTRVGTNNYVMLAWEQGRYMYWPFRDAPDLLTDTGQKLFVNAAWYAMRQ